MTSRLQTHTLPTPNMRLLSGNKTSEFCLSSFYATQSQLLDN